MLRVYEVEGVFEKNYLPFTGYPGFAIRGAFGYALKKLVCRASVSDECKQCGHYRKCIYAIIFEPSSIIKPDAKIARKGGREGVTRPFTIKIGDVKGNRISFSIVLLGDAIDYEHVIVMALTGMGFEGLGMDLSLGERRRFKISKITCNDVVSNRVDQVYLGDKGYILHERSKAKVDLLSFFLKKADSFIELKPRELQLQRVQQQLTRSIITSLYFSTVYESALIISVLKI
ncbi:MAG: hypothetical protein N3F04_07385 [Candidatus Nezhaarchaeota archaeon]|nr:hypothetical protein [Candidatus Nezhaarchaeota archaeon]MCX8142567.1 hypothetical protein [Candidatus Nezhaarchaeota archaeon]